MPYDGDEAIVRAWMLSHIYGSICHRQGTLVDVGSSAAELTAALTAQEGRRVTEPRRTLLGGHPATVIELALPADFDPGTCDSGFAKAWPAYGPDENDGWPVLPGQRDFVYVASIGGERVVFVGTAMVHASRGTQAELVDVIKSIRFSSR